MARSEPHTHTHKHTRARRWWRGVRTGQAVLLDLDPKRTLAADLRHEHIGPELREARQVVAGRRPASRAAVVAGDPIEAVAEAMEDGLVRLGQLGDVVAHGSHAQRVLLHVERRKQLLDQRRGQQRDGELPRVRRKRRRREACIATCRRIAVHAVAARAQRVDQIVDVTHARIAAKKVCRLHARLFQVCREAGDGLRHLLAILVVLQGRRWLHVALLVHWRRSLGPRCRAAEP